MAKHRPGPDRDAREDREAIYLDTIHQFLVVYRYLRRYQRHIHDSGHSGRQLSTLRYLLGQENVTMGTLAGYLFINESSTSELVSKLESDGLVERIRSKKDNRVVHVSLTAAGRRAAEETDLGGIPLLRERLRTLSTSELALLDQSFTQMVKLLEIPEEEQ